MGVLLEGQDSKSCSVRGQIQAHFELKDDVIQKVDTPNVLILIVVSCLFFFFFFSSYLLLTYATWAIEYLPMEFLFFFLFFLALFKLKSDGNLLIQFAWPALP